MSKRQISKLEFALMVAQHRALDDGRYFAAASNIWCVGGIHGSQTYSHPNHGILTVEVQTHLESEEKTYWVFEA